MDQIKADFPEMGGRKTSKKVKKWVFSGKKVTF